MFYCTYDIAYQGEYVFTRHAKFTTLADAQSIIVKWNGLGSDYKYSNLKKSTEEAYSTSKDAMAFR